jgi:putative ABC transport system ATP-binding protein
MSATLARLAFRGVSKSYESGDETVTAIDGLDLEIERGQLVALFGPSGSGKSTLLKIAAAVLAPDRGTVHVDGRDVTRLAPKEAAEYRLRTLGWVKQEVNLIGGASAQDNAALKLLMTTRSLRAARRDVSPLLAQMGLTGRARNRAETLSVGERQRVMIARALSLDPGVVLADEPTGSLDARRSREVLALLRDITHERGVATLMATHDEHAVAFADAAYVLEDGVLRPLTPDWLAAP